MVQVALLLIAGWQNRFALNADGVAYLRLAGYYAHGQTDLMISGYWGPMLSWQIAPLLVCGLPPLVAGRLAMGFSAVLFFGGGRTLLRNFDLVPLHQLLGVWLIALATVFWSVDTLSPDLLVGGIICFAIAAMISPRWPAHRRQSVLAGACWGLAYFAKAVALPLAFGTSIGLALLGRVTRAVETKTLWRQLGLTMTICAFVASPWIAILSIKYQRPTFSTTARIAHAIVGPPDVERYHPYGRTFHQPESGRVTSWEDPSRMAYRYWSPFANREYAAHQLKLVEQNFATILQLVSDFDLIGLGALACLACLVMPTPRRERLGRERWRRALVPLVCLGGIYLPVYVQRVDARYFYAALPLLWVAVAGALAWLSELCSRASLRYLVLALACISFFVPVTMRCSLALEGLPNPASDAAQFLAEKFHAANLHGSIAGSGLIAGGRSGLFLAFLLNVPWLGDEKSPAPEAIKQSKARFFVVHRRDPLATRLESDSTFHNLGARLFASPDEAAQFPIKVFQVGTN